MTGRLTFLAISAVLAGCTATVPVAVDDGRRPLETLPGEAGPADAEADLLATARERYGSAALERALAAPTHVIVKRFAGRAPPPPPGAAPDWRPPTPSAMLIKEDGRWLAATPDGWRGANPEATAEIEAAIAGREFWSEPATNLPCPDAGALLLLLEAPTRERTVRLSRCTSIAQQIVLAALRA
jgi:hypothetical protein